MDNNQIKEVIDMIAESCKNYIPKIAEYEIHSSTMWAIIWAFVVAVSVIAIIATYGYTKEKKKLDAWYDEGFTIAAYAIGAVLITVGLVIFFIEIDDIYTAKYLPEKMFMQYVRSVLENGL